MGSNQDELLLEKLPAVSQKGALTCWTVREEAAQLDLEICTAATMSNTAGFVMACMHGQSFMYITSPVALRNIKGPAETGGPSGTQNMLAATCSMLVHPKTEYSKK